MKANIGNLDRGIRASIGVIALAAYFFGAIEGSFAIVLLIVGFAMLGTAAFRWCPPYALLGINTGAGKADAKPEPSKH
tara:strand:- start:252 stop:485 length:234 start_codon:yes stop_codon:yes gene_type:complete